MVTFLREVYVFPVSAFVVNIIGKVRNFLCPKYTSVNINIEMAREPIFRRLLPYGQMPQTLLIGGFAGVILVGTLLLLAPWSQTKGEVGFVDALFTATSAVCVTGLVVVNTGTAYTLFGQTVIIALIQIGGLGIMTFAALAYLMLGRRLSLASQAALHDTFFQRI